MMVGLSRDTQTHMIVRMALGVVPPSDIWCHYIQGSITFVQRHTDTKDSPVNLPSGTKHTDILTTVHRHTDTDTLTGWV